MSYRLTRYEQETIINWNNASQTAEIYTHDRRWINKLRRLARKYPDDYRLKKKDDQNGVTYEVSKRMINIRPPYNEEHRQQQIEEAKIYGFGGRANVRNQKVG